MFKKMIAVALSALIATSVMPLSTFAAEMGDSNEAVAAVEAGSLPPEKEPVGAEEQTAAPEVTEEVTAKPVDEKMTEVPVEPTTAEAPAQPEKEKDAETVGAAIESDEAVGKSSFTYSVSNNQVTITGLSDEYLTDLVIPDTIEDLPVTTIKENAFSGCSQVTSITVPNSVTSIGVGAFKGTNPTKVTLPFVGSSRTASSENAVFGFVFGSIQNQYDIMGATRQYPAYNQVWNHYYIPKTIKEVVITDDARVPANAFYNCDWIEKINIARRTNQIGNYAFYNCSSLKEFDFPESVVTIGTYTFYNCTSLQSTSIPDEVNNIPSYAFYNCSSLVEVNFPSKLQTISDNAFYSCKKLNKYDLEIPDGVTSIGSNAFSGCSQVTSITVPNSVTSIGVGAFKGTNPTKITLPFIGNSRTASSENAVFGFVFGSIQNQYDITGATRQYPAYNQVWNQYYIPKTIKEVVITDDTRVPANAFYNCDWIEKINIAGEIAYIGNKAFYNCTSLQCVPIPDKVNIIPSYAFYNCISLEEVNFPAELQIISEYAFYNCKKLNKYDLEIPNGVTTIDSSAFSGCDQITSITVPNSVTSIGVGAFKGTNPTKVVLPFIGSSRTASSENAVFGFVFGSIQNQYDITGATRQYPAYNQVWNQYYIPKTIKEVVITDAATVPYHAFYNCDWIEKVTINDIEGDASLVGSDAFYNCKAMTVYINRDTAVHTYCERNGIRHCSTKSIALESDSLVLFRNGTGTIGSEVILLNDKVDTDPETVWTSSDPEVAKVDRYTGVISAVAPGTATITADSEGVTATAQVTVYFKLEGITLNKTTTEIDIDKTETLTVIYDPDNTTDSREISWASSDDSIASVDENGVVTAHKKGNATITATGFGDVQASCTVQVLVPMTAITFDNSTITIPRGTRQKVPFTVSPSDTTDTYTVTSSDTNVATVDRFGNVTAKKIGTALITVQSSRGLEQTCVITVNSPASSIIISDDSKNLFVGKSFTLTTEMSPKDSTDSITWTSTNEDVAVVTPDGQVTAIAKGSATIIATADSGVSAVCEVSAENDISATTIYLAYQETEYDGSEKLPEVSVYYNGEKLVENTDYVLAYLNNLNAGDASVYVTSLYDGTDAERKFTINPLTIKALDISYKSTMTYTGSPLEALEEITYQSMRLTEGTDYKVRYENNTGAGPVTMTVTGMGNFCDSTTKTYTIAPKSANLLTVMLSESSYIYDGNAKTPEVTVKDGNKTLAERTDYNVSYSKNIHAGDAVVTVTGLNNYGSATTVGFKIYPKSISNVTVRLDKTVFAYDGTEKCPVTRVEDNGIELTEGVDYRVEYKENQEAGTATATIIGQNDYTGTLATEFSIIQLGDIDRNGIVNIQDVTVLQRHLAEFVNNDGTPIVDEDDAEILKIADVDHSETITISDVTTIQRYLAEIIDSF